MSVCLRGHRPRAWDNWKRATDAILPTLYFTFEVTYALH